MAAAQAAGEDAEAKEAQERAAEAGPRFSFPYAADDGVGFKSTRHVDAGGTLNDEAKTAVLAASHRMLQTSLQLLTNSFWGINYALRTLLLMWTRPLAEPFKTPCFSVMLMTE